MKTKLLFAAICLFSFLEDAVSQEYHPLLNNSHWVVSDWVSCCRPPYTRVIDPGIDTMIGEVQYKKFKDPFPYSGIDTVYVREDVLERKVYRLVDGTDKLIYDFSLENGDEITLNSYGAVTFIATVDEVGCNDGSRKRITLNSTQTYNGFTLSQVWIEGIGTVAHPFYPDRNMWNVLSTGGGTVYTTLCGFQANEHIYGNPDVCTQYLSNESVEPFGSGIVFSPNPFNTELTILCAHDLSNASLKLYNIQGQLIRKTDSINGNRITVMRENLSSGIYLAELSENGQTIKIEKLIVN